jgi:hypothetical protein
MARYGPLVKVDKLAVLRNLESEEHLYMDLFLVWVHLLLLSYFYWL